MFHEDFDKSTRNSFFSNSFSNRPPLSTSHFQQQQALRDRLPPIQTQLNGGGPSHHPTYPTTTTTTVISPGGGRSSSTSPESFFAKKVIQHHNRRLDKYAALAELAGAAGLQPLLRPPSGGLLVVRGAPVKTNTSSALGVVGSSGASEDLRREERRRRKERSKAAKGADDDDARRKKKHRRKEKKQAKHELESALLGANPKLVLGSGPLHPDLNPHSPHNLSPSGIQATSTPIVDESAAVVLDMQHPYPNPNMHDLYPGPPPRPLQPPPPATRIVEGPVVDSPAAMSLSTLPPIPPPAAVKKNSLPAYSALDPYISFGTDEGLDYGLGRGTTAVTPVEEEGGRSPNGHVLNSNHVHATDRVHNNHNHGGNSNNNSRGAGSDTPTSSMSTSSYGRSLDRVNEENEGEEEDVSLIGSGAEDLRPQGQAEWMNSGGMLSPAIAARMADGSISLGGGGPSGGVGGGAGVRTPRSAVSRIPEEVVGAEDVGHLRQQQLGGGGTPLGHPHPTHPADITSTSLPAHPPPQQHPDISLPNTPNQYWPSSRLSALQKVPPATLLQLLRRAEEEGEMLKAQYTTALAEVGAYRATIGRLEAKVDSAKERERVRHERAKVEKDKEREREREREKEREKARERARVLERKAREGEERAKDVERRAAERVREVEREKMTQGLSLSEAIVELQRNLGAVTQERNVLRVRAQHAEGARGKAEEAVKKAEGERDEKEREAVEARRAARKVREEAYASVAKEQGRREGWEEGMKRGRGMAEALVVGVGMGKRIVGDGTAFIEEITSPGGAEEDQEEEERKRRARRREKEKEKEKARVKKEKEREKEAKEREKEAREREREAREREKERESEVPSAALVLLQNEQREKERLLARMRDLEDTIQAERERMFQLERDRASEVGSVVGKVRELEGVLKAREREMDLERQLREREAEQARVRDLEAKEVERKRELEEERRRLEREREKKEEEEGRRRMQKEMEEKEKERTAREVAAAAERERARKEAALVKEKDDLKAALDKEKEEKGKLEKELVAARTPQITLSYLPMPAPPAPVQPPPPPAPPAGTTSTSSSRRARRRDRDSGSDSASDLGTLDILNLPNFGANQMMGPLGTIHEMATPASVPKPPIWMDRPPVNYADQQHHQGGGYANPTDYLSPPSGSGYGSASGGPGGRNLRKMGSGSTSNSWDIRVVPPTRPGSALQHSQDQRDYGHQERQGFGGLSPNMGPPPRMPSPSPVPTGSVSGPYDRHPYDIGGAARSPSAWAGGRALSSPISGGRGVLPMGFIPQSMTPRIGGGGGGGMSMPAAMVDGRPVDDVLGKKERALARKKRRDNAGSAPETHPPPGGYRYPPAGMTMPEPSVPNIVRGVPYAGSGGGGEGMTMPEPTVPMYQGVPRAGSSSGGTRTPAAAGVYSSRGQTPGGDMTMPTPTVPNIIPPAGSTRTPGGGMGMPEPTVPNYGPAPGHTMRTPGGGVTMPEPTVPNIVPPPGSTRTPGGGMGMPEPTVPNYGLPPGSRTPGGTTISMPEATVPNYGPPAGSRTPVGGVTMPEPNVPNIIPSRTPVGGLTMPEPTVPNIVPPPGSVRTPGGGMTMPEPTVPNIVPPPGSTRTPGGGMTMPEPSVPNIVPEATSARMKRASKKERGTKTRAAAGAAVDSMLTMPEPTIPSFSSPSGAGVIPMPEAKVVDYTSRGPPTPQPDFPPVIPAMPGSMSSPYAMPRPDIVDYTGGGGMGGMPEPVVVDYTGTGRGAEPPVLPSSLGGVMSMPTPTIGMALDNGMPPVIPGVTTSSRSGGGGGYGPPGNANDEGPFIPPSDFDSTDNGRNAGGGGGGLFGSVFGGGGWGSSWGGNSNKNANNNEDEEGEEDAFEGGGGGFVPPNMRNNGEEEDDMDSTTMRNTRMNAQNGTNESLGAKKKKLKGKKR